MKIRNSILLATLLFTVASCSRGPVEPRFGTVAVDTLLRANGYACHVEYRFASIRNAAASPALEAIESANAGYFFELEEFTGTAPEAAAAAIRQTAADLMPPANSPQADGRAEWQGEISAESEGSVVDTLLCYVINRSSYLGGAHGMYGTECHVYSLADGYEVELADLFDEGQLRRLDALIREDLCRQYDADNERELEEKGFFPEYIRITENFLITAAGITFFYNPYKIGCYALGAVEVSVSRETLAGL